MVQHPNPDPDEDDLEALGTPFYQGNGLSVRALTAEELQQFLDAHADQPTEPLGSGWAALDRPGHPLTVSRIPPGAEPASPQPQPVLPAQHAAASLGHPGRSARTRYRRRRAAELAVWTRSLTWRAPMVLAAGLVTGALAGQAGLPGAGLASLTVAALVGWRLRFRPSTQARVWQRGAKGEQQTARLLGRLGSEGYVVFHDLAMPDSPANLDHLVVGPSGVFVIDSKQWTGQVHQSADELVWHDHYRLDRTLATVRWQAETLGRLLGVPVARWSVCMAPASRVAGCARRAWRSSPRPCSAAPSAVTRCCRTPRSSCSPPPSGCGCALPPEFRASVTARSGVASLGDPQESGMAAAGGRGQPGRDALMRMARAGVGRPAAGAVGCGGAVEVPSLAAGRVGSPYACEPRAVRGAATTPREDRWMTEGQGELPFDPEMQTGNEQEQVRASLERLGERLAEWQANDHADAGDVTVELPDGTLKWLSELTQAEVAAGFRFRPDLQGPWESENGPPS